MTLTPALLLVDDDPAHRLLLREAFEATETAWTIVEIATGEDALREVRDRAEVHLVVLDLRMPGVDGFETLDAIRDLPGARSRVPVAVVSGMEVEDARRAVRANLVFEKPDDLRQLRGVVDHIDAFWREVITPNASLFGLALEPPPSNVGVDHGGEVDE